jgi:hypothetical protein
MTPEDIRSELEKLPFIPFRLHLVSGSFVDVTMPKSAEMLKNSILVFHSDRGPSEETLYDVIALRNIERLEQLGSRALSEASGSSVKS